MALVTEEQRPLLRASRDCVRHLYQMLKCVAFRENATLTVNETGIKVVVDDLHCVQGTVYLKRDVFQQYEASSVPYTFRLNIAMLCECLNLFGHEPASPMGVTMSYAGAGAPLRLVLDRAGIYTQCAIRTVEPEEAGDGEPFEFDIANVRSRIIMKPDALRDALAEVESSPTASSLTVSVTRGCDEHTGNLRLLAGATDGLRMCYDMPSTAAELVERFECDSSHEHRYRASLLKKCVGALKLAGKISLRTDEQGCVSIQCMVDADNDQVAFVEFFCAPDVDVEDEF